MDEQQKQKLEQYLNHSISVVKNNNDYYVLIATISVLLSVIILIALMTDWWIFLIVLTLFIWVIVLIKTEHSKLLGNALRIQSGHFSYFREVSEEISANLKMPNVDVFVIHQELEHRIFSTGHFGRFSIVIHSELAEGIDKDEARALIVHEMAHIMFKHTFFSSFIRPLSEKIRLLGMGAVLEWIFGFWTRRTELTADRLAVLYTRDPHTVIMALVKEYIGEEFGELLQEDAVIDQMQLDKSLLKQLSETTSDKPFLMTRCLKILEFARSQSIPIADEAIQFLDQHKSA